MREVRELACTGVGPGREPANRIARAQTMMAVVTAGCHSGLGTQPGSKAGSSEWGNLFVFMTQWSIRSRWIMQHLRDTLCTGSRTKTTSATRTNFQDMLCNSGEDLSIQGQTSEPATISKIRATLRPATFLGDQI